MHITNPPRFFLYNNMINERKYNNISNQRMQEAKRKPSSYTNPRKSPGHIFALIGELIRKSPPESKKSTHRPAV